MKSIDKKIDGWKVIKPGDLENELYTIYAELLTTGDTTSNSMMAKVLKRDFKALETKETDNALKVITEIGKIAKATGDYFNGKESKDTEYYEYLLNKRMMPWQKEIFNDPSKRVCLFAGRRAGKTYEIAADMIKHCLPGYDSVKMPDGRIVRKPRECVFVGLTIDTAKAAVWGPLCTLMDELNIPHKKNLSSYTITFSNGATIRLWGNSRKEEREKLRGGDYSMIVVDECQSQQGLLYILESAAGPIVGGRNGKFMLAGTAPLSAGTYWESIINSEDWSHYHATMKDNITIPDYQDALQRELAKYGGNPNNIAYRREILGEIAYDTDLIVYPTRTYETDKNKPSTNKFVECVIGLDYGFRDATAIAPILIDGQGNGWLRHEFKKPGMSATDKVDTIKAKIDFIKSTYGIPEESIHIFADNSDLDIAKDLIDLGIPNVCTADKSKEKYQIGIIRDSLESGKLNIQQGGYFDQECDRIVYKWDIEHQKPIYEIDDKAYHGDICDAVRYAWYAYTRERHWEQSNQ